MGRPQDRYTLVAHRSVSAKVNAHRWKPLDSNQHSPKTAGLQPAMLTYARTSERHTGIEPVLGTWQAPVVPTDSYRAYSPGFEPGVLRFRAEDVTVTLGVVDPYIIARFGGRCQDLSRTFLELLGGLIVCSHGGSSLMPRLE